MKRFLIYIFLIQSVFHFANAQESRTIFISEYIANQGIAALELYNPTTDTIQLKNYSIVRQGKYRFNFPGGILLPYDVWVGCRGDIPMPYEIAAVADSSWPATLSIWYLGNDQKIELLRNDTVIDVINADPRNNTVAGIDGALSAHTLVRKPETLRGDTTWDASRGTNADDSQWIVYGPSVYSFIGYHRTDDTATTIFSEVYPVVSDTIILTEELSADSVRMNLAPSGGASFIITDILGNAISSGLVRNNYRLKVTADAGNMAYYVFRILAGEGDSDIVVESMVYTIRNDSITNISVGTGSEILLRNLLLFPEGVKAQFTDQAGNPRSGAVTSGDRVVLTARDGVTKKILKIFCHEPVPVIASTFQVHKIAKPRIMPPGAPAYSDVNMTSRKTRTPAIMTGPVALDAARSFHGTNFRWCYITSSEADRYPGVDNWVSNEINGNGFKLHASVTTTGLDGSLRGVPLDYDSQIELSDGTRSVCICPNKPMGRQLYLDHVKSAINMGSGLSIQVDENNFGDRACYCNYCKAQAQEWGMQVGSIEFIEKSVIEFWKWVFTNSPEYVKKNIGYSCNNGSPHVYNELSVLFDFMIGECDPRWGYGADKYFSDERFSAESIGKIQVFNLSVKGMYIEDPTILWRNRSVIGLAYGVGGNCIVPWDSYMDPVKDYPKRYFGKPDEYADLFGFVRANSRLLDGYETAFDYMPNYNDPRYGGDKVVTITGNDRAFAWMRAVPGDSSAAVVIHLVDWRETAAGQPLTVNIKAEYLFSGQDFGIYLVEPERYDPVIHKEVITNSDLYLRPGTFRGAQHEAVYQPLRKITRLDPQRNGSLVSVSIDSIPTYAMLVLVPATQQVNLSSNDLLIDQEAKLIKGFEGATYTSELLSRIKRSPLASWMVLDEHGIPVYDQISDNCTLAVLSPEGRKLVEYSLSEGDDPELELHFKGKDVPAESSVLLDPVTVDSLGEACVFTVINRSSITFIPDTVVSSENSFQLLYTFTEILPGDSADLEVRFRPVVNGISHSLLSVRNKSHAVLPFSFALEGEGLAAEILVYHESKLLNAGTGILNFGNVKTNRDTTIELSIVNNGKQSLIISDIGIDKPQVLSVESFSSTVQPGETGSISLKYSPTATGWQTMNITIRSNSAQFREYTVNGEGTGISLNSAIKVEYNSGELPNNTGIADFGKVQLPESLTENIFVKNTGSDNLYITDVISSWSVFKILSKPLMVEPGKEDTIIVKFTPQINTTYSALVTITSNDTTNSTFKFTVTGVGVNPETGMDGLTRPAVMVYPNPAISHVKIRLPGSFSVNLLSMKGESLLSKTECMDEYELDVKAFRGMYILEVRSSKHVFREKLVIQP